MSGPVWRLFGGRDAMADAAVELLVEQGRDSIRRYGRFNLGISGGRAPLALFQRLREGSTDLPWPKVRLYWADERWVPYEHEDSNFGGARRLWLGPQGLLEHAWPVDTALETPEKSAQAYAQRLDEDFGSGPLLDLCLLGMGADGHTASIFPGQGVRQGNGRNCMAVEHPDTGQARVTLTLEALNRCRRLAFLVEAPGKEAALQAVRDGGSELPAALAQGLEAPPHWLVSGWGRNRS